MKVGTMKFRAWDKIECKMGFVVGIDWIEEKVVLSYNKPFAENHEVYERDFNDVELMKKTDFADNQNQSIYEGDILLDEEYEDYRLLVEFLGGKFVITVPNIEQDDTGMDIIDLPFDVIKVIGDKYRTPELLK